MLGAGFLAACATLLRSVRRGRLDWIDAGAWKALALLLAAISVLLWYVVWLPPLATDRRLWHLAIRTTAALRMIQLTAFVPHLNSVGL